ncbi:glycine receptor subunit alpha-2 [Plakobranchus ocellatus]|uniref:Glycine receptor subunit alpha-2 n=1 Tax=Plakobranchus ocellatus TaxID=259542 RepID=A0AAV3Y578_9GAST|nr:glycine receptor subunit alpha-2 [Plakobranchus ocellatus]
MFHGINPSSPYTPIKLLISHCATGFKNDFTLNLFVTQTWLDDRLKFYELINDDYLELDSKLISRFWVPDLYFVNEKSSNFHDVTVPNTLLHLHSDGRVIFKMRISLTATCYMALHKFPMDLQVCSIAMKSFGYSSRSLQFHWRQTNPLTRQKKLEMSQFALISLNNRVCDDISDNNELSSILSIPESYTCLAIDLELRRSLGFYMIQLYIPSALIVVLSWVSFCLDVGAVPARISLGILTVLTMTNMKTIAVASLPKVSYIKAIDVWMVACLAFVFSALLEFAVVNAVARRQKKKPWEVIMEAEPLTVGEDH